MVGVKYIASVSFGKDSLAMLLRLLKERYPLDFVVFYNTGMEFACIYKIRDAVIQLLNERGIRFVELSPDEPFIYSALERKIKYRKQDGYHYGYGWCGGPCRWATQYKLQAIQRFKASLNDEVIDYVGIAADEPERFDKAKCEGKVLPLVQWGMTEADCLQYCRDSGFSWQEWSPATTSGYVDLYDILDRVSCWCCANKNLKELRNIYKYLPQYWQRLKDMQFQIERPFKGFYKGNPVGIFELERRFEREVRDENKRSKAPGLHNGLQCV